MKHAFGTLSDERLGQLESKLARGGHKFRIISVDNQASEDHDIYREIEMLALEMIGGLTKRFQVPKPVYFCFLDGEHAQATVANLGDAYCIVIYEGLVRFTHTVMRHMVASDAVSDFLGLPPPAPQNPKEPRPFLKQWLPPLDALREGLAFLMSQYALYYTLLHEYAHIRNGHSDFLIGDDFKLVDGRLASAGLSTENVNYHALELDADAFAVMFALYWAANSKKEKVADELRPLIATELQSVRLMWLVMLVQLLTFDGSDAHVQPFEQRHAPLAVRRKLHVSIGEGFLQSVSNKAFTDGEFAEACADTLRVIDGVFHDLGVAQKRVTESTEFAEFFRWYKSVVCTRISTLNGKIRPTTFWGA